MKEITVLKKDYALVLSGGGGKGAYEIGVWKALQDYGVAEKIRAVSGTSVGALNAVLFAQGDLDLAIRVWSEISPQAVMTLNSTYAYQKLKAVTSEGLAGTHLYGIAQSIHRWILKRCADQGVLSKEGLSQLIDCSIRPQRLSSFGGPIYVAAYNTTSEKLEYFNLKGSMTSAAIKQRLLASASLPFIFGKSYIDGALYWDGGLPVVGDNTPVNPLYRDGYRNFIVVYLSREEPIDRDRYPGCKWIEIMPQRDLGGMVSGTMNFNAEKARESMERGYEDAFEILEQIFTISQELNQSPQAVQRIGYEANRFRMINQELDREMSDLGSQIDALLEELQ